MSCTDFDRIAAKLIRATTPRDVSQAQLEGIGDLLAVETLRGKYGAADLEFVSRRWILMRGVEL